MLHCVRFSKVRRSHPPKKSATTTMASVLGLPAFDLLCINAPQRRRVMKTIYSLVCILLSFAAPAFATVTVTSPKSGATVTSPVSFVASATTTTCAKGVASMGIYVNNVLKFVVDATTMNTTLTLAAGSYSTTVEEWDKCGGASYTKIPITVTTSGGGGGGTPGVKVTTPLPNTTVTSPVSYVATATTSCSK